MLKNYFLLRMPKEQYYEEDIERWNRRFTKRFNDLDGCFQNLLNFEIQFFELYNTACLCIPGSPDARKYLTHSLNAGYAYTRLATEENLKLTFEIDEHRVELESAYEKEAFRICGYWDERVQKALLLRHHEALMSFLRLDPKVLEREVRSGSDPALCLFAEVYRSLFSNRKYLGTLFYAAKRAFERHVKDPSNHYRLFYSQIELIQALLSGEGEAAFNAALEQALLTHRDYYANNRPDYWPGVTALPIAAIAALAFDHYGYRVTVENEYLPQWIIDDRAGNPPWKIGEKSLGFSPADSINFQSVEDELRYLEENDLEAQLEHIEEHLDFLLRWDDPMEFIPAVFPHLWHIYLTKTDYRFGGMAQH